MSGLFVFGFITLLCYTLHITWPIKKVKIKMQKLVNVIALLSGLVSLSVVGGGAYLYLNKDALIDQVKEQATEQITEAITGALPGMLDSAMPELPSVTGGAVPGLPTPTPSVTGGALPF